MVLIETAQRLEENLGSRVILARVGADEFAIAIKTDEYTTEAIAIANELDRAIAQPYRLKEQEILTSASRRVDFKLRL